MKIFQNHYKFDLYIFLDYNKNNTTYNMANYSEMTHAQLVALCSKQQDRIEDLEYDLKEAEEYRDDLEDLQADLSDLDVYKDGLTGVCDYNDVVCYIKARLEEIEELKTSIQTTTSYHTDKNELLQKEIEDLKEEAVQNKQLFDTTFGELMKLKEASVPKEILFAERRGLKEQISDLKEKYDELYELHYK